MTDTSVDFDVEERRVRIGRSIAETERFAAEQHKLLAEVYKRDRDARFAPMVLVASAMAAGAAPFGAGAALSELFGR